MLMHSIGYRGSQPPLAHRPPIACVLIALTAGCLFTARSFAAETPGGTIEKGNFRFSYDGRGVNGLANPNDPFGAQILPQGQRLGLTVRYRTDSGEWLTVPADLFGVEASVSRGNAT